MDNDQIKRGIAKASSALSEFGRAVSQAARTITPVLQPIAQAHLELESKPARSRSGKD